MDSYLNESKAMLNPAELTGNFDISSVNTHKVAKSIAKQSEHDLKESSGQQSNAQSKHNASQYSFLDANAYRKQQEELALQNVQHVQESSFNSALESDAQKLKLFQKNLQVKTMRSMSVIESTQRMREFQIRYSRKNSH